MKADRPIPFVALIFSWFSFAVEPSLGSAEAEDAPLAAVVCEGSYRQHLQGVCIDDEGAIFWCFTSDLVKTDAKGRVTRSIPVESHHGDLCYLDGRIYVAVNFGKFNHPEGMADSWVYIYDSGTLEFLAKHAVPEVFHGAGGMDSSDGHFFVVGGLPDGVKENYVYEYDEEFRFVMRHTISSGTTRKGIQTAAWHDGVWWFGCYGTALLKTDAAFHLLGRWDYDVSLGIAGVAPDRFLLAKGTRTPGGGYGGALFPGQSSDESGLARMSVAGEE